MPSIACGHCGQTHSSVAEVRACSIPDQQALGPNPDETRRDGPIVEPTERRNRPKHVGVAIDATVDELAGPDPLGRSVLVNPTDAIPAPWHSAEEIAASQDASSEIVERLHQAWRQRERVVIRWSGPLPQTDQTLKEPFHQLSPTTEIPNERLLLAVTANTVDARSGQLGFEPLQLALNLGASHRSGSSDVEIAGKSALVDGGPLDLTVANQCDFPVVPRAHLVAGILRACDQSTEPQADLAPDQLAAVGHKGGPARILAPAGSGKTRVLTERARFLVQSGVAGRSICLVAYNRRAKDEMQERLSDVVGLQIRTLNSLALALATGTGPFRSAQAQTAPRTIDERESRRLLDSLLPGRRRRKLSDPLEPWIDALSACRLGLRDPAEVEQSYGADVAGFPDILDRYRDELKRRNALDFDEQILVAIDRMLGDPEARRRARQIAPVVLVDEFQDLTPAHLLLLRLLAGPAAEVVAVGDDDQTIYGYAGASPDWLIDFEQFFPGASSYHLTTNYRCPPEVVTAATNLLSHNQKRVAKEIKPADPEHGVGGTASVTGLHLLTGSDPQLAAVDHIRQLLGNGSHPNDIAILSRVNAALLPPALHLHQANIPVVRPQGLDVSMIERSGVGAALAWLRLVTGPKQGLQADDIRLALRRPPRSLHPRIGEWASEQRSVQDLRRLAARLNTERDAQTVESFADDLETAQAMADKGATTAELLEWIYHDLGLLGAASQLDNSQRSARRAAHADELAALAAVANLHADPADFEDWLRQSIEAIARFDPNEPTDGVTLATVHTTKGLEWPHVVVHDVRGDLFPHPLATDIEEERRIFHVGLTRGGQSVAVTVSGPPSPFVADLATLRPPDAPWPTSGSSPRQPGGKHRSTPDKDEPGKGKPERSDPSTPREAALRDALTTWRRQRAKEEGIPAYRVLDNRALDSIAKDEPSSLVELGQIKGIGPHKLDNYGSDVLGVVADVLGTVADTPDPVADTPDPVADTPGTVASAEN